jgi:hypothetical protein
MNKEQEETFEAIDALYAALIADTERRIEESKKRLEELDRQFRLGIYFILAVLFTLSTYWTYGSLK